jgi:hypothetical protein
VPRDLLGISELAIASRGTGPQLKRPPQATHPARPVGQRLPRIAVHNPRGKRTPRHAVEKDLDRVDGLPCNVTAGRSAADAEPALHAGPSLASRRRPCLAPDGGGWGSWPSRSAGSCWRSRSSSSRSSQLNHASAPMWQPGALRSSFDGTVVSVDTAPVLT